MASLSLELYLWWSFSGIMRLLCKLTEKLLLNEFRRVLTCTSYYAYYWSISMPIFSLLGNFDWLNSLAPVCSDHILRTSSRYLYLTLRNLFCASTRYKLSITWGKSVGYSWQIWKYWLFEFGSDIFISFYDLANSMSCLFLNVRPTMNLFRMVGLLSVSHNTSISLDYDIP